MDTGDGVVLLTDMFGGTPSNLAISVMDQAKVEVIAGVNLPMLIKLASLRQSESLAAAVLGAQEAGRKYINVASQLLADARVSDRAPPDPPSASARPRAAGPPDRHDLQSARAARARRGAFVKTAASSTPRSGRKNGTEVSGRRSWG